MNLAKPALDVGLYTNDLTASLTFWKQAQVPFDTLLKLGGGLHQHRHTIGESVLKVNHARTPLPERAPSGLRQLWIARDGLEAPLALQSPDADAVTIVPTGHEGVNQIKLDLVVSDLPTHRHFYGVLCGFPEIDHNRFAIGASLLHLHEGSAQSDPEQRAPGLRYMTVQVFDVRAEHANIIAQGGREGMAPVRLGDVAHISFVRDPDGNWIEISQRKSITGNLD